MRTVGVATFARSDYSSCRPVMYAIAADPTLQLHLIVGGMHLSPRFGYTVELIEGDGFRVNERIQSSLSSDTREAVGESVGETTIGLARSFARLCPDILVIVGDRVELLAVAAAAGIFGVPLAHISGGDVTEGAIDNQVRHAMTKMSHLHFVSMQEHANRLIQMGEERWRVIVTGDPALDLIRHMRPLDRVELENQLQMRLEPPVVLVTYHPTTLGPYKAHDEIGRVLAGLDSLRATYVLTYPNADPGSQAMIDAVTKFAASRNAARAFPNLGQETYYGLLGIADLVVGNSSSGIWEAPSFQLPAVNIGDRQRGRLRADNVIDVGLDPLDIANAIRRGLDPAFRASLAGLSNPYGDGHAAERVLQAVRSVELDSRLLQKKFVDQGGAVRDGG